MTVRENLEFPLRRHPYKILPGEEPLTLVKEALEAVGLLSAIDLMPSELSGGMKKRIALARTLILRPKIILYDEPTSGLDPVTSKEISLLIRSIQKRYDTSAIIITHDLVCARLAADRLVLLHDGVAYKEGSYEELLHQTDPVVKAFFT
jgi:phospholipid/cholesterol/gamma-HCH transport system ATP-binding protein